MKSRIFLYSFAGKYTVLSMTDESFKLTSDAAKKLSRLGAAKGGDARASKLSPERRSEIARTAIQARWEKAGKPSLPRATHTGDLKIGNISIPCAVLETGTRVVSESGLTTALLGSRSGALIGRNESGRLKHKMFQRLTEEIGDPKLREHLASVVALMKAADTWPQFIGLINRALPRYKPLPLFDQQSELEQ